MDCVLLPRAPKAFRLALEREQRQKKTSSLTITIPSKKDKGKAKDPSEYPPRSSSSPSLGSKSQAQSSSSSSSSSPSTTGPAHQPPVVKYLVIDPQLALRSNYESLPPEIDESPDRYCHCCRTRSGVGKLKMRCVGTGKITSAERGPTTWHGRHTPPPLRRRHASGGHALSTEAHIFIPRGPRGVDPVDELPELPEAEPVLEEDEEPVEEEPVWGDRHRAFEGDYSAADASLLDAVSGAFEFGIEHGPGDLGTGGLGHETDGAGVVGHLGVQVDSVEAGPGEVGVESGAGDLVIGNTGDPVAGAEGEPPAAHTPPDDASRGSSEALGGTLAYPPTESSQGSQPDAPMDTVPVESATHTITGTLDGHAPAGVLEMPAASAPDDAPGFC
ncbi:hypothetical protein RSAG8_04334, partial [Rhizoctonia solani AG-8 WAC10335]